jgi:glutamine amidotransferase
MSDVAVVDYGMGNLRSVAKAIEHVSPRLRVTITSDAREIHRASRIVFPGQGAMPDCMREMDARGLRGAVIEAARRKPFLGICIGLQMLFETSEEGDIRGLGLLPGNVRRFPADRMTAASGARLKVPHMGWNEVEQLQSHDLWAGIPQRSRFYFVHSYFVEPGAHGLAAGASSYGIPFASAVAQENIFAVQFHPEKSQAAGMRLLANFIEWQPAARHPERGIAATPAA